jgi:hypothetical protein
MKKEKKMIFFSLFVRAFFLFLHAHENNRKTPYFLSFVPQTRQVRAQKCPKYATAT